MKATRQAAAGAGSDSGGGRQEGVDFSGTNNQEDGVDEADFVKTDGYHIYTLNGNRLHIMGVPSSASSRAESVTQDRGPPAADAARQRANRVVVFSWIDTYSLPEDHPLRELVGYKDDEDTWYWRIKQLSKITVLDITDKTRAAARARSVLRRLVPDRAQGRLVVRVAGYSLIEPRDHVGLVAALRRDRQGQDLDEDRGARPDQHAHARRLHPAASTCGLPNGQFTSNSLSEGSCRSFYRPTDSHARGISSIISFDLLGSYVALGRRPRRLELVDVLRLEGHRCCSPSRRTIGGGTGGIRTIRIS